jgi:PAS domain S-box-containing protein
MHDIEEMAIITNENEGNSKVIHHELLLSITLDEEIVQFNRECERVTAYPREEAIHKKFSEILLPADYLSQWKTLLDTFQKTREIDEFTIPIKTKQGTLIPVTWNGFFVKDEQGNQNNICLLGISTQTFDTIQEKNVKDSFSIASVSSNKSEVFKETQQSIPSESPLAGQPMEHDVLKEKIVDDDGPRDDTAQYNISILQSIEKLIDTTSKQVDELSQMVKDLSGQYETINERLRNLERKDVSSEEFKKHPMEHLEFTETDHKKITKKKMKTTSDLSSQNDSALREKLPTFFSDPFGYIRQRKDLEQQRQECERRQQELKAFEAQLTQEKKIFDTRIDEFRQWRDKLELLETEIEKRRQELLEQDVLIENHAQPISLDVRPEELKVCDQVVTEVPNYQQMLDGIPQSAVIVQRGILKQVNAPFAELIGYSKDEIVEKNFFDLIAADGLGGVEQYYLNRLKGESTSSYTTVFSTKQNEKVMVEVSVKPALYNGEKAEIAILTILETQKQEG